MEKEHLRVNHLLIALIVFICVFGSALLGLYAREHLPEHHLSDDSIGVVKLATGLIATMAALVLGLLISSAKNTFDTTNVELVQNAAMVIQLDRVLARYGPQTQDIRVLLKNSYTGAVDTIESGDSAQMARLNSQEAIKRSEGLQHKVEELVPGNEVQQALKAHALQLIDSIFAARWLTLLQAKGSIPLALLVVLVTWLSIIFGTFGLFAQRNGTIIAALLMCALSTSGAIFLIEELNRPLDGLVGVSVAPMRDTLSRMGQ
ncbi:MAG: hypothetical protein JWP42_3094 [Pseudomonas sp.]|nr:hypothetical protein [Pseudomonas sp.]